MTARAIDVHAAQRLIDAGAVLFDVREPDEHARERIANARLSPLSRMSGALDCRGASGVIFHCRSGSRTAAAADRLATWAGADAYILIGGLDAWKAAGLPTVTDRNQPIELMRQVQIAAGGLVLLGVGLGMLIDPGFHALSGFVGAGLLFAGVSGTCGMARLLGLAPWNRVRPAATPNRDAALS